MKISEYNKLNKSSGFSRSDSAPRDSLHRDRKADMKRGEKYRKSSNSWMDEWEDEFCDDDQDRG